jgi:N-acetylglucosamine-6-phosphate deacetylase
VRLRSERIITPAGTIAGEVQIAGDGTIERVGPGLEDSVAGDVVDLGGHWLAPGYIDGHVHGGAGGQFNTTDPDEIAAIARFHAEHGTTALLATTVSAPIDELVAAIGAIASCAATGGAVIVGIHLEGPFLSPGRPGAMDPATFHDPDPGLLEQLLTAGDGTIRQMTLAPERPGAMRLIGALVQRGILASVGHSDADLQQVRAAVAAGARSATHVYNAMAPLHHRAPGVLGAVLDLPEVNCELICDGVHVSPPATRLVHRVKGARGMRLVTDATAAAGMAGGEYRLGQTQVRADEGRVVLAAGDPGVLAGSTLTMDGAVRNAVRFIGLGVEEAVALASAVPARVLGLDGRTGAITSGLDGDLVVLDADLRCLATIVRGQWVHGSPETL